MKYMYTFNPYISKHYYLKMEVSDLIIEGEMQQPKTKFSVEFMSFQPVPSHFYMCSRTLEFECFTCVLHAQGLLVCWSKCIWDYLFKKLKENNTLHVHVQIFYMIAGNILKSRTIKRNIYFKIWRARIHVIMICRPPDLARL